MITHKDSSPPRVNEENLARIAKELKTYTGELIIVLGGGAHGHQAAYSHGYADSKSPKDLRVRGIPPIRHNMVELATAVETSLNREGTPTIVIPPFCIATLRSGLIHEFPISVIRRALDLGLVVVTHGDVCFDSETTASILSGDTIAVYLTEQLNAETILIGTDVDGVMDDNPKLNPSAAHIPVINQENKESVLTKAGPSTNTDVTGGMSRKVSEFLELAKQDREIIIFNLTIPGRLESLLQNEPTVCTRIQS